MRTGLRTALAVAASLLCGAPVATARAQEEPPPQHAGGAADPQVSAEDQAELDRVAALEQEVVQLFKAGRYSEALPKAEDVLAVRTRILGDAHPLVATAMSNVAAQHIGMKDHEAALRLTEDALQVYYRIYGREAPELRAPLGNLAMLYHNTGREAEAVALQTRLVGIIERTFGPKSPELLLPLRNFCIITFTAGCFSDTAARVDQYLALLEATGASAEEIAQVRQLGQIAKDRAGDMELARKAAETSLDELLKRHSGDHEAIVDALCRLAGIHRLSGRLDEACRLARRAVEIADRLSGAASRDAAETRTDLAIMLNDARLHVEARSTAQRAVSALEALGSADDVDLARARFQLAVACMFLGQPQEAYDLYERAIATLARVLGPMSDEIAGALVNQAECLRQLGSTREGVVLLERAREIGLAAEGTSGREYRTASINLATFQAELGETRAARELLAELLRNEEGLGEDLGTGIATVRLNLAVLDVRLGEFDSAEETVRRLLKDLESRWGPDHLMLAAPLGLLARIRGERGDHGEAVALVRRALAIHEAVVGTERQDYTDLLGDLVYELDQAGHYEEEAAHAREALDLLEARLRRDFAGLTAAQRSGLVQRTRLHLSRWIVAAHHVEQSSYPAVLRFKGLVTRVAAAERRLEREAGGEPARRVEELQSAERRVAQLANSCPFGKREPATWREEYAAAAAERERLASELSRDFAPLRVGLERIDLSVSDVQGALRQGEVLLDDVKSNGAYYVYVVHAGLGAQVGVGVVANEDAADELERTISEFARLSADPSTARDDPAWTRAGTSLATHLIAEVAGLLPEDTESLVICPDDAIALVPFAALPVTAKLRGKPGELLIDRFELSSVSMAQDLVPVPGETARGTGALVVGGVEYGSPGTARSAEEMAHDRPGAVALRAPRGRKFAPLPQTKVEAEAIAHQLGDGVVTLLGSDATEARFRMLAPGRRFVHVATHGFVRDNLMAGMRKSEGESEWLGTDMERRLAAGYDPLLLAALALAGASDGDGGEGDDGILTAAEAAHLDLSGVDVVALSACQTALGHTAAGEGVVGLVQSFQMAGAHDVLASLWQVDDEATRLLMEKTYAALLADDAASTAGALRAAALAVRGTTTAAGRSFAGPAFWAAFGVYRRE